MTAAALLVAGAVPAQTANELSDAARTVFSAFPQARSFRKIVRDVDQRARQDVERQLPFKVHFNELGPHALYVPFRKLKPVGLMYVRTEDGGWGFSRISWSLSLDLRVVGFRFLRARSRHRFTLPQSPFANSLIGLGYDELAAMLDSEGKLVVKPASLPAGSEDLALAVVRSAMKTILVTRTVWQRELAKLRDLALGLDAFPAARDVRAQPTGAPAAENGPARRQLTVRAVRAFGAAHNDLGIAAETETHAGGRRVRLRWTLTPKLEVLRVTPVDPADDAGLRAACTEMTGRSLSDPGEVRLAGTATLLVRSIKDGGGRRE